MTKIGDGFAAVALEAAAQWGMFTTLQARTAGLAPRHLDTLTRRGHVTHVDCDLYRIVGTPDNLGLDELRAAWLTTTSATWLPNDLQQPAAVVSHLSAAHAVYGLGTLRSNLLHLTTPSLRRTRSRDLRLHVAQLSSPDWQLVDGLPVTAIARTIADIYVDHVDGGHLGDILRDALEIAAVPARDIIAALDSVTDGAGRPLVEDCLNQNGTPSHVLAGNEILTQGR